MKRIQSKLHKIDTYDVCKISLSCFDDKINKLRITTLAYFHKDLKDYYHYYYYFLITYISSKLNSCKDIKRFQRIVRDIKIFYMMSKDFKKF